MCTLVGVSFSWSMLHVSHYSPYLLKNVKYEWMNMTEFSWVEKHDWSSLLWLSLGGPETPTSHLCVTFLVSGQSGWEYFVILHRPCLFNILICISKASFSIKYLCQSINQYFTEMCQICNTGLVNITKKSTGSRKIIQILKYCETVDYKMDNINMTFIICLLF